MLWDHHQLRLATKVSDQKHIIMPMHTTFHTNPEVEADVRKLRQAITEARGLLRDAAEKLRAALGYETIMPETPLEAEAVM
jgi:predicted transcriptional regulator